MITINQATHLKRLIQAAKKATEESVYAALAGSNEQLHNAVAFAKDAQKELDEFIDSLVEEGDE